MCGVPSTFIAALRTQLCRSAPSTMSAHRFPGSRCWEEAQAAFPLSIPGILVAQIDCDMRSLMGSIKLVKNYTESWARPPSSCPIRRCTHCPALLCSQRGLPVAAVIATSLFLIACYSRYLQARLLHREFTFLI